MTDLRTLDPRVAEMDRHRGHRFQPPKAELAKVPALYADEDTPLAEKVVYLHFFTGSADWYVAELDPDTWEAFGWAELFPGCGEWGSFNLLDLAVQRGRFLPIERDKWFTPKRAAEVDRISR